MGDIKISEQRANSKVHTYKDIKAHHLQRHIDHRHIQFIHRSSESNRAKHITKALKHTDTTDVTGVQMIYMEPLLQSRRSEDKLTNNILANHHTRNNSRSTNKAKGALTKRGKTTLDPDIVNTLTRDECLVQ